MKSLSLRTKVFFLFAGATLLIVVPTLLLIAQAVEQRVYGRAQTELAGAATTLEDGWSVRSQLLQTGVSNVADDRTLVQAWEAGRTRRVREHMVRSSEVKNPAVLAMDTAGTLLFGPQIPVEILRQAEVARSALVAFPADTGSPVRVAVSPVLGDSGRLGIVGLAQPLDLEAIRGLKKALTPGTDIALVVGDSLIGTTLPDSLREAVRSPAVRATLGEVLSGRWQPTPIGGQTYLARAYALPSQGVPTAVILFRPIADELRIANGIRQSLGLIGALSLALSLLLAAFVARIVARPAQGLAEAANRLAQGDFGAPLPRTGSSDEIGQLSRAFGEMRSAIEAREARLRSAQAEMIHREKLAAMGRLVAQLSHEINNPIYNIQNCLEALERRGDPSDPNRQFLELAQEELSRMAALTRQLLNQSRPQGDAAASISLNAVAQRVLTLAGDRLAGRGVRVEAVLDPALPSVVAHPESIQQVLTNLVDNAADAMPEGGLLRVATRPDGESVEMVVEDTGGGIPPDVLPHIFEAFYTTKPGVTGLGLGLFVSEGIVRGHRGRITVESHAGRGSRFTVRLPRETLDEALAAAPAGAGAFASEGHASAGTRY